MSAGAPAPPPERTWPLHKNPWVWGAVVGVLFITSVQVFGLTRRIVPEPERVGQLPAWSLVDQDGAAFGSEDLAGGVWVAGFFFSRCTTVCPQIMHRMSVLQERIETYDRDIRLVAITVDPDHDTPEVLREVAGKYDVHPPRWTLLTGSKAEVQELVVGGFKTAMGDLVTDEAGVFDIAHTSRLVIVDEAGGLRGYYGIDEEGLDEVYHRAQHVLREAKKRRRAAEGR